MMNANTKSHIRKAQPTIEAYGRSTNESLQGVLPALAQPNELRLENVSIWVEPVKREVAERHLKRQRIVHDLAEDEKHCHLCAQDLRPIGEDTSERYEFIPEIGRASCRERVCQYV